MYSVSEVQGRLGRPCSACQDHSPTEWNRAQEYSEKDASGYTVLVLVMRVSCLPPLLWYAVVDACMFHVLCSCDRRIRNDFQSSNALGTRLDLVPRALRLYLYFSVTVGISLSRLY